LSLKKIGYPKGLLVRAVWECCDELYEKLNRAPTRKEFYREMQKREPHRVGISTHSRQWGEWMRHHKFRICDTHIPLVIPEEMLYPEYRVLLFAVTQLGPVSATNLVQSITSSNATIKKTDILKNIDMLTVNSDRRHLYIGNRQNNRTDSGNCHDLFFQIKNKNRILYDLYIPEPHGIWDIDENGIMPIMITPPRKSDKIITEVTDELFYELDTEEGDFRRKAIREVVVRQGQPAFRRRLIEAYEGKCAITDCSVQVLLEAAHIKNYSGAGHNKAKHGILLKADIHTLFDRGLVWVDSEYIVRVSRSLKDTEYASLDGRVLRLPKDKNDWPLMKHLINHSHYWNGQDSD